MNEDYESWLRIAPLEIYSTAAQLKRFFLIQMGMKCNMETLIGQEPETKFDVTKISLASRKPNQINANIVAVSTYADASKIIRKNFSKILLQDQKLLCKMSLFGKRWKMVIALDLVGSLNGIVYLAGFQNITIKLKKYILISVRLCFISKLLRTANWLAQGIVLKKLKKTADIVLNQI
jgi:hypothetical protein